MIYGYDFSTEVIEVNYSNGIGYILLHCCESSLGKDCVVFDGFFEHKLNYEMLRVIHNKFVNRKLGKQFGGYICLMYLCGMETIKQIKQSQSYIGNGYTNLAFILKMYKESTLPRMFYDMKLSVEDIDNNKDITKYLKSAKAIKDGFSQDSLFDVIVKSMSVEKLVEVYL